MPWYGDASPVTPLNAESSASRAFARDESAALSAVDPSAWIVQHSNACSGRYRTWLEGVTASNDVDRFYRVFTDDELRRKGLPPRQPSEVAPFDVDRGAPWHFARANPFCMPIGKTEWQEFNRRCWFLGVTTPQGLEFRRRARDAGASWP